MTRRWVGQLPRNNYGLGFQAAMNSPEILAMAKTLRDIVSYPTDSAVTHMFQCAARDALVAYEVGLESEEHREGRVVKREKAKFESAFVGPEDTWEESDEKA